MHILIPIKKYLAQYLRSAIGTEYLELKKVTAFDAFLNADNIKVVIQKELSETIFPLLCSTKSNELEKYMDNERYTVLGLKLTDKMMNTKRVYLRDCSIGLINKKVNDIMKSELMPLVFEAKQDKARIDHVILNFMNKHEIDEDMIRYDSLKKMVYRDCNIMASTFFMKKLPNAKFVLDLYFANQLVDRKFEE